MNKSRAIYSYTVEPENNLIFITDHHRDGTMYRTVTNSIEDVLTEIQENESIDLSSYKVTYYSTDGITTEVKPIWKDKTCIDISFL